MSEQNQKSKRQSNEGQVEWSFDFANLGSSIKNMANSLAGEEEIKESSFVSSLEGVEKGRVKINFAAGNNFISALEAGSANLLEAHLKHVGEIEFTEEGDTTKSVKISQKGAMKDLSTPIKQGLRLMANSKDVEWHVNLSPDVPLELNVNGGVGPTKLDLNGLNISKAKVDAGVGQFTVMLPQQDNEMHLDMNTGVGETKVYVPENVSASLDIDAGVGSVDVTVPPNAAVQIRAKTGIGSVHIPTTLRKYDNNHWQSEGFDLAEQRITIKFNGGVGSFHVREAGLI